MVRHHFVLGFVFGRGDHRVLLKMKDMPQWQKGCWNGIGGKIKANDGDPREAMKREAAEEVTMSDTIIGWRHCITFVCPGGTVYVFRANSDYIAEIRSKEQAEAVGVWAVSHLPSTVLNNLLWMIPMVCADLVWPVMVHQSHISHSVVEPPKRLIRRDVGETE